jgi:hypothetical protein
MNRAACGERMKLWGDINNVIYPGWKYRAIELVRIDERTGNPYVLVGDDFDFEIKPTGGYEP